MKGSRSVSVSDKHMTPGMYLLANTSHVTVSLENIKSPI